jgi:hypothetical protein
VQEGQRLPSPEPSLSWSSPAISDVGNAATKEHYDRRVTAIEVCGAAIDGGKDAAHHRRFERFGAVQLAQ